MGKWLNRIYGCSTLIVCILFSLLVPSAHAAIGDSVATGSALTGPAAKVKAKLTDRSRYSIRETQHARSRVREFISPAGTVFGMAWAGPADLSVKEIFGDYLDDYQEAVKKIGLGRTLQHSRVRVPFLKVQGSKVVLERVGNGHGHGASFQTRVYAESLIPTGVDKNEIH